MDVPISSPPGTSALRESFGDGKIDITRKITACVACRRQKVKCQMPDGQSRCTRCRKRNLPCTVNRSLQTLLEEDATWKSTVVQKLRWLEDTLSNVTAKIGTPEAQDASGNPEGSSGRPVMALDTEMPADNRVPNSREEDDQPRTWEVMMDPHGGPASIPASCVSESGGTTSPNASSQPQADLVATGVLTLHQALCLFDCYHFRLDHFLYRILGDHTSLNSIRMASPILTAAVCTVGALHSQSFGHLFHPCLAEYKSLVAEKMFSRRANADDVRGLCIGAFWLHELSWALIGHAVRIASEINLHSAIYKALKGNREAYLHTRLYYLVYVCDHHFSIAYGRPPMSREGFVIDSASRLLETENATEDDARLISQVKEWSILAQVSDTFGVDVETPIAPQTIPQLRRYSIALDTWFADWYESFQRNKNVGNYPKKGVGVHFHFAKLYLGAHAFRGAPSSRCLSPELEDFANAGILSAMSILQVVVSDSEFQTFMNGLPLYFDTMIAFSVVFLLRVGTMYAATVRIDTARILTLVTQTVATLGEITQYMHHSHLLVVIAEGLERLLSKCQQEPAQTLQGTVPRSIPHVEQQQSAPQFDMTWMECMASFDFQTHAPDLDDWWFHYSTSVVPPAQQ